MSQVPGGKIETTLSTSRGDLRDWLQRCERPEGVNK